MSKIPLAGRPLLVAALLLLAPVARAQGLPFVHFQDFLDSLGTIAAIPDAAERDERVGALWAALQSEGRIPFTEGDSAAFLWRGSASTVAANGDHNGWGAAVSGAMSRVGLSDVWMRVYSFPEAARLDYKLVVSGSWILDPNNPHQQYSGVGTYNSELRMPAWVYPEETIRQAGVPQGALSTDLTIQSQRLGYAVRYRVYTPAGYGAMGDLPVIYATDGHEYADDRMGTFPVVLDNLIADGRAAPCLVVLVDPRDVVTGVNRRQEQYVQNEAFAAFIAEELVPAIDAAYRTRPDRDARVILGTSLGGLFSAYLGVLHPDTFGRLAIQSPAFWVSEAGGWSGPSIYEMVEAAEDGVFSVYMSTGTIHDAEDEARRMRDVFTAHGHPLACREVPEGHSWGNWRALLDEALMALVPGPAVGREAPPADDSGLRLDAVPNPSRGVTALDFALETPARVDLACYDALGRLVARVCDGEALGAGYHRRALALPTSGAYVCRLKTEERAATRVVTVAR